MSAIVKNKYNLNNRGI